MQTFQLFFKHAHCYYMGLFRVLSSTLQVGFSTGGTLGSAQILVGLDSSIPGRQNVWNDTKLFHCFNLYSGDQTRFSGFAAPFQSYIPLSKNYTEPKVEFWPRMAAMECLS